MTLPVIGMAKPCCGTCAKFKLCLDPRWAHIPPHGRCKTPKFSDTPWVLADSLPGTEHCWKPRGKATQP